MSVVKEMTLGRWWVSEIRKEKQNYTGIKYSCKCPLNGFYRLFADPSS